MINDQSINNKNNKDFYVIIPARMNSVRLKHKMLLPVGDLPLVVYTAKNAQKSNAKKVVVATDHIDIANACKEHKIDFVMTKEDHISGTDRIAEASKILNISKNSIVINVQGDEPLMNYKLINQLAEFTSKSNTPVATIASYMRDINDLYNPNIVKLVLDKNQHAIYFSRANIPFFRDFNLAYNINNNSTEEYKTAQLNEYNKYKHLLFRHLGIYAYQCDFLQNYSQLEKSEIEDLEKLEQLRVLYNSYKIAVLLDNGIAYSGVDTIEDLNFVNSLIQQKT